MEAVLDHGLAEVKPQGLYPVLNNFESGLFCGYIIKSQYDEERLEINPGYNPQRLLFKTNNGPYHLYGVFKPNKLNSLIKKLEQTPPQNIGEYSSLLTQEGLSCLTCFLFFSPGLYPVDSYYKNNFFSEINFEDFSANFSLPPFQRIGHIYLFALVNHQKK